MAHIVIAGAGIVGVSTAIWLQRAGHAVTLVDRMDGAMRTSYGNAGVLAAGAILPVPVPGLAWKLPKMRSPHTSLAQGFCLLYSSRFSQRPQSWTLAQKWPLLTF